MDKVSILGIGFDNITMSEAVDRAVSFIAEKKKAMVVTPNSEILYLSDKNPELKKALSNASLVLPDGIGIIYASKLLKTPIKEKIAGIDFAKELIKAMAIKNMRLYILGAKPGVAEKAAENIKKEHPGIVIAGTSDGYFKNDFEAVFKINGAGGADVVFCCLGAPKQELFMAKNIDGINAYVFAGLGGSADVFAGHAKRSPDIFIKFGLEWFYRMLKEPKRIGRIMRLPLFMLSALKYKGNKGDKNA